MDECIYLKKVVIMAYWLTTADQVPSSPSHSTNSTKHHTEESVNSKQRMPYTVKDKPEYTKKAATCLLMEM